jgi:hypothetical protein
VLQGFAEIQHPSYQNRYQSHPSGWLFFLALMAGGFLKVLFIYTVLFVLKTITYLNF